MSEPGSSCPMCLSAELTIVPSRKTAPDPMTVATRVQRCRVVIGATAGAELGGGRGHLGAVSHRLTAMPGPVALVGAGEFLPAMARVRRRPARVDRARPAARRRSCRPRPTPTARTSSQRWAAMGVAHFGGLGAEVEPVLVRDRDGADDPAAAQAVGEADLDLPVGRQAGVPARGPRRQRRRPGAGGRARARRGPGRVLGRRDGPRRPHVRLPAASRCRGRCAGGTGSASLPGASVVPHYDAWPEPMSALIALQAPRGSVVLGIDEETARRRPGRRVAGPRPVPGHGLAGPPSRALPRRRHVPALRPVAMGRAAPLRPRDAGSRQSGLTVRKQSEQ